LLGLDIATTTAAIDKTLLLASHIGYIDPIEVQTAANSWLFGISDWNRYPTGWAITPSNTLILLFTAQPLTVVTGSTVPV
jgi:hypothetical protein